MSFSFSVNLSPATGAAAIYSLKQQLKSAGWTVTSSSDGTTYNASGDQISSGSSGAGGMANNSAWFVIRQPTVDGYQRALSYQRSNAGNNTTWRVKYSHSGNFSGGSPGTTQTPSASDEQLLLGGGSDASPTFGNLFTTDGAYKYHIMVGGSSEQYVFYALGVNNGGSTITSINWFDRLAANTYAPEDADPFCILTSTTEPTSSNFSTNGVGPFAWYRKSLSGESFVRVTTALYLDSGSQALIANGGSNAWNGRDDGLPILYGRTSNLGGNTGFKGISKFCYWKVANRSNGDTLSISSTRDKVIFGDIILPWDGSIPSL